MDCSPSHDGSAIDQLIPCDELPTHRGTKQKGYLPDGAYEDAARGRFGDEHSKFDSKRERIPGGKGAIWMLMTMGSEPSHCASNG